jgi:hypothetical protein
MRTGWYFLAFIAAVCALLALIGLASVQLLLFAMFVAIAMLILMIWQVAQTNEPVHPPEWEGEGIPPFEIRDPAEYLKLAHKSDPRNHELPGS